MHDSKERLPTSNGPRGEQGARQNFTHSLLWPSRVHVRQCSRPGIGDPEMSQKILVVEDDPDIMRILLHTLTAAGYTVFPAYGGDDALKKVPQVKPELILTDLAMPNMSGVEVIELLRRNPQTSGIPIVAVTAYVWDGLAQAAGQVGCDGFIAKPFSTRHLLEEVRKYLAPKKQAGS
jgi:CheY-like chemotaxis protein